MGGNVITNFDSQILYSIGKNIAPILLLLVPLIVTILCLALRKLRVLTVRLKWRQALATLGILLTLLLATMGIMYAGRGKSFSVYKTFTNVNTSTDSSYKSVGMLATTVQELRYMVFGSSGSVIITPSSLGTDTRRLYSSNSYNVIERIDFTKLAESTDDAMRKTTDEYLAQVVPTRKNNYTGLLQDYNLITICAESFCPWFISEELTPTLYKLSHTGIIFDNYYGTFQSVTTNGEYTMCMGLYPDMSRTKTDSSFNVADTNYLPFCISGKCGCYRRCVSQIRLSRKRTVIFGYSGFSISTVRTIIACASSSVSFCRAHVSLMKRTMCLSGLTRFSSPASI